MYLCNQRAFSNAYNRYKGFERGVGKFMARPQEELPTLLHDMDIHIFDIFDMAKCDGRCPMTVFIECVPRGQDSCSADSNLNIGANNTGMNNRGNNNQGWCNLGPWFDDAVLYFLLLCHVLCLCPAPKRVSAAIVPQHFPRI